jgi:hypothetical protein
VKTFLPALVFLLIQQFGVHQAIMAQNKSKSPASKSANQKSTISKSTKPVPGHGPQYEKWYAVFLDLNASSPAFIDKNGKVKLTFDSSYTLLEKGDPEDNLFAGEYMVLEKPAKVYTDNEYFITDRKGNLKAVPKGVRVVTFSNDRIFVQQNRKWAIWKADLTPLTPFKYSYIKPYCEGLATAELDNNFTLIDENGVETIPADHLRSSKNSEGRENETYNHIISEGLAVYAGNGKFGIMDRKGKTITPPVFDLLYSFHNGLAFAIKNDTAGYVNRNGKYVLPGIGSRNFATEFSCGRALIKNDDNKRSYSYTSSYINTTGQLAFPGKFISAGDFNNGYAIVKTEDTSGKKKIIDTLGKVVYEGFFENAWFGPELIVMTTETSFAGFAMASNNYKYLDYKFQPVWQPPVDKRIITNLKVLPESDFAGVKFARLGIFNWHYKLKEVEPFLNKANLVQLRLTITDGPYAFPSGIVHMTNLEELDLSFGALTNLSEDIGKLQNLKVLNLEYTRITQLPESIYQLKQLQTINLGNTKLTMEAIMAFKQKMPGVKVILKN